MKRATDRAMAMLTQEYRGDIDIFPPIQPGALLRLMKNPEPGELRAFIEGGERATWPLLARILDQARVRRSFERGIERLRAHVRRDASTRARPTSGPTR
jgi:TAG lipase/steryl ester hydrolase/phospholipase A2/LPA acyltransferase